MHNKTQFSVLQSTIQVNNLIKKAVDEGMPAVAISDSGNMMAAFHFMEATYKHNSSIESEINKLKESEEITLEKENELKAQKILPIVGCEFRVCHDRMDKSYKDNGYQIPFLRKTKWVSKSNSTLLSRICRGFYYVPRIDQNIILQFKEDVIVTTGGLYGQIPQMILNEGESKAEEAFCGGKNSLKKIYIELFHHGLEEEDRVNAVLLQFAEKHNVKYFASNDTYYLNQDDADAHDVLLCIKDGERKSTPKGRGREGLDLDFQTMNITSSLKMR